ncbi:MFS transporter [Streptomyces benahoarensis]|uniref:MFS transporter n=1 Tax=Streptomyces benahoarensis TaxID=2595054 RepID=A0A553YSK8_9ACTN|nr:MFS transporter [Streptomyces benahoarensis]TSB17022.1 MFS transporter [Streptomyces benahoarensis]TSB32144.1 MFS transporter [Streptomyces benahoarensis]
MSRTTAVPAQGETDASGPAGMGTAAGVALITVLTSMPLFLVGATSTLINRELGWDAEDTGLLLAAYWFASLLGAFLSRKVEVPVSAETTVGVASFATAVGLALGAWAGGVGLVAGTAFGGLVYGYSQPHTNSLLMRHCARRVQGFAFGLKQAAVPMATLLGSVAVPALAVPYGWRAVFLSAAGVCALYGVVGLCARRGGRGAAPARAATPPLKLNSQLLGLAVAGLCGAMVGNSLGGFLIASGTHGGLALSTAGFLAAAGSVVNIAVRLAAGVVVDRGRYAPRALLWQLYAVGALGTSLLALNGGVAVSVAGALLAFGGGWGWAGLLHYVAGVSFPAAAARATAFTQMGVSLGGACGPMLFGWLVTREGFGPAWLVLTAVGVVAALLVPVLGRRAARSADDAASGATESEFKSVA